MELRLKGSTAPCSPLVLIDALRSIQVERKSSVIQGHLLYFNSELIALYFGFVLYTVVF